MLFLGESHTFQCLLPLCSTRLPSWKRYVVPSSSSLPAVAEAATDLQSRLSSSSSFPEYGKSSGFVKLIEVGGEEEEEEEEEEEGSDCVHKAKYVERESNKK